MSITKELKRLNDDPNFFDLYAQGMDALKRSGVFDVLRLLGQPEFVFDGKDQAALAAQAARAFGWNDAINTLQNIENLIEAAIQPTTNPRFQYGGLDLAVLRGDILPEERNDIKHGRTPDPGIYKPKLPKPPA